MDKQLNQDGQLKLEKDEISDLSHVTGGIWDYSNRMGRVGQHLEDRPGHNYGVSFHPKNLDEAKRMALEGWVSIP